MTKKKGRAAFWLGYTSAVALAIIPIVGCSGSDDDTDTTVPPTTEMEEEGDLSTLTDSPSEALELMQAVNPTMRIALRELCAEMVGVERADYPLIARTFGSLLDEGAAEWGFTGEELALAAMEEC
jgi:hypothetical protein